ncbi:iron-sulfur cluster assembly scaffold protein [Candidatus Roizmanbacteria bacterium CG09_land_8_20_14_0_10_41_9]|uniref:Iron-sulfur cluster assembly scaffold protein n=1 Tax=Candidatus Roizmanbacteria bacterium CG09_land_8_20_14_0_10_41_9 TaxID=1974850 RepID=A0A2H0WTD1_9BACT|nr:MAG: iron-sulfur cluster assembly scaffold protein [Candidatus Roizmanbacteria bacterium CG09_land_8_20_14_0_10_41_9]
MTNVHSYTKKVISHFKHPHNYGKLKRPDGTGEVGNVVCGDVMHLYIKIGKNKQGREIIKDIGFETYGCAAAIATSSVITDLAKNKTLTEALLLQKDDVIKTLKSLPPIKVHCSLLAVDALNEAIHDYFSKHGKPIPKALEEFHKRIEKSKCEIEDRYGEWVGEQRK